MHRKIRGCFTDIGTDSLVHMEMIKPDEFCSSGFNDSVLIF